MTDIFVSYVREEFDAVKPLVDALESEGWSVWYDVAGIRGGDDFEMVIEEKLDKARAVVVCWSDQARVSPWVRNEATEALNQSKIVPVIITPMTERLPLRHRSIQCIDLCGWEADADTEAWRQFRESVSVLVSNQSTASIDETAVSLTAPPEALVVNVSATKTFEFEPETVLVRSGEFLMGSDHGRERPRHQVVIPNDFWVGKYPVTFDEYDAYVTDTDGEKPEDEGWGRGRRPVINVSWNDAMGYVNWLAERSGRNWRLMSEAEWEYTARAGTKSEYWWGDEPNDSHANFGRNVGSTTPVDHYAANPFGLHDMLGNVWEWVEDHWHDNYEGAPTDGSAWVDDGVRVVRGGSWIDNPYSVRSANRGRDGPGNRDDTLGFRVARTN